MRRGWPASAARPRPWARLGDHPHIVSVFDIGEEAVQPYLVSQSMAGGDFADLIHSAPERRIPLDQALEIADQVCQALEHAHVNGVIHRDVKPGNVWLTAGAGDWVLGAGGTANQTPEHPAPNAQHPIVAKLGDFGLAVAPAASASAPRSPSPTSSSRNYCRTPPLLHKRSERRGGGA